MAFFQYPCFSRTNAIIRHVAMMVTNQVAERKDQYPLSFIYTHRDTRSDLNVTENKRSTWLSLSSTSITFPLAIVVVRGLTNCIDINLMVATCRHSGINYHTCARLLSTSLFIENNEEIPRGEEEEEKQSVQIPFLKLTRMR
jgi:hypothetical protein